MLLLFGGSYPLPELLLTVLEEPPDDGLPVELTPELDVPDGLLLLEALPLIFCLGGSYPVPELLLTPGELPPVLRLLRLILP